MGFDSFDTTAGLRATPAEIQTAENDVQKATSSLIQVQGEVSRLTEALSRVQQQQEVSPAQRNGLSVLLGQRLGSGRAAPNKANLQAGLNKARQDLVSAQDQKEAAQQQLAALRSSFDLPRIHYEIVSTALFSIERVLAQRLSNIGSFDSAGIAAEFEKLSGQEEDAKDEKRAIDAGKAPGGGNKTLTPGTDEFRQAKTSNEVEMLQVKLQKCVVRAKV
ncbi:hypothetical protein [Sphingomonas xinjiangensis]|uniref:Chromosome segregation ATPase n=1 Tax=Sphingomonas xinjiangensis TaxID=643568 RepID=A0A840YLJ6_9SPHN|nr:hypothetical protein [Sphingomonas xinjiangensis]MBB5710180.1 chromosome segregation ATPase [Sphingomonas xinjiangensis]